MCVSTGGRWAENGGRTTDDGGTLKCEPQVLRRCSGQAETAEFP
jgi:hypothetical protein